MKKFISLSMLLILTRYADVQTTWLSTPDLTAEANPLVSKLGMGWTGLIFAQVIFLAIILYGLWIYCFRTITVPIVTEGLSLAGFISLFYFSDSHSFSKIFYKLPANKNSFFYSFGYIMTYTLIYSSLLISSSTVLLVINETYRSFYVSHEVWRFLYLVGFGLMIFFSIRFFKKEKRARMLH